MNFLRTLPAEELLRLMIPCGIAGAGSIFLGWEFWLDSFSFALWLCTEWC